MTRRDPDALALVTLVLAFLLGLPGERMDAFRLGPAVLMAGERAASAADGWRERFEQRRDRVWERLDRRMQDLEQRLAGKEQRLRVRTAGRFAA